MIGFLSLVLLGCAQHRASPTVLKLEAEDGQLVGTKFAADRPGFSGRGYVTGFIADNATVVWHVQGHAGIYQVRVGYSTPGGPKGFGVSVNGRHLSGMFPDSKGAFTSIDAGRMELGAGDNVIGIDRGWGYFDLDYVEFRPARAPTPVKRIVPKLSDPRSTAEARRLYAYLTHTYGDKTLSGQYDDSDCAFVKTQTGKTPAIFGGDLIDYSPSRVQFGSKPEGTTESYIRAAEAGQVLTLSWHWNAPSGLLNRKIKNAQGQEEDLSWYKGFYTNASTFDVAKALADHDSDDYRLLLRDIDAIAVQLKKLELAHVPILWRPLHEAEGGWFWWGAKGPEPCKRLWRLLYERLTVKHGLHNLIWVWNSIDPAWYPGDDCVDIVATDQYPSDRHDSLSGLWDSLLARFNGRKPLAVAEFGGVPDVERMWRFGVKWLYFVSWTGDLGAKGMSHEELLNTYQSQHTLNKEQLGVGH